MKTTKIHLADQSFQAQQSEKCDLLVRISAERLSYAIVDQTNSQLKVLYDSSIVTASEDLNALISNDPFLAYHYNKIKISSEGQNFTFIPNEIYADADLETYAHFIQPNERSEVMVKQIHQAGIRIIHAVDRAIPERLNKLFPEAVVYNQANALIESSLKLYRNSFKNVFVVQFNQGSFEALLLKKGKLTYYNIFTMENADEFNYFLLNLIKQLNLNYADTDVVLSGDITEEDELYTRTRKYFNMIAFADISKLVNGISAFKDIPKHQFFGLIGLNVCE